MVLPGSNPIQVGRQARGFFAVTLELSANWHIKSITFLTLFVKKKLSGVSSPNESQGIYTEDLMKDIGETVIRWITESETSNAGFNILRSEKRDSEFTKIMVKPLITHTPRFHARHFVGARSPRPLGLT